MTGFITLLLATGLSACTSKQAETPSSQTAAGGQGTAAAPTAQQQGQTTGVAAIEIKPQTLYSSSRMIIEGRGFDSSAAQVEWLVNGAVAGQGPEFKSTALRKGDNVQARAIHPGGMVLSAAVRISNRQPEVARVFFTPAIFRPGDTLGVDVTGKDEDGDNVAFYYEWTLNGNPAGTGRQISSAVKRGDRISVRITPFDGEENGPPLTLNTEVGNMPPIFRDDGTGSFDGRTWIYQVKAEDPDGDPLSYSIKTGPEGMTVDPKSGKITWSVPKDYTGTVSFTISVADGKGSELTRQYNTDIK